MSDEEPVDQYLQSSKPLLEKKDLTMIQDIDKWVKSQGYDLRKETKTDRDSMLAKIGTKIAPGQLTLFPLKNVFEKLTSGSTIIKSPSS